MLLWSARQSHSSRKQVGRPNPYELPVDWCWVSLLLYPTYELYTFRPSGAKDSIVFRLIGAIP